MVKKMILNNFSCRKEQMLKKWIKELFGMTSLSSEINSKIFIGNHTIRKKPFKRNDETENDKIFTNTLLANFLGLAIYENKLNDAVNIVWKDCSNTIFYYLKNELLKPKNHSCDGKCLSNMKTINEKENPCNNCSLKELYDYFDNSLSVFSLDYDVIKYRHCIYDCQCLSKMTGKQNSQQKEEPVFFPVSECNRCPVQKLWDMLFYFDCLSTDYFECIKPVANETNYDSSIIENLYDRFKNFEQEKDVSELFCKTKSLMDYITSINSKESVYIQWSFVKCWDSEEVRKCVLAGLSSEEKFNILRKVILDPTYISPYEIYKLLSNIYDTIRIISENKELNKELKKELKKISADVLKRKSSLKETIFANPLGFTSKKDT